VAFVVTDLELLYDLDQRAARWVADGYAAGLYQGDPLVSHVATIDDVIPATFSGYVGYQVLTTWTGAVMSFGEAVIQALPLTWTHNGGPVQNLIGGYYVVAPGPRLAWIERRPDGPILVSRGVQALTLTPRYASRSKLLQG